MKRTTLEEDVVSIEFKRTSDPPVLILASLSQAAKHGHAIQKDIERLQGTRLGPGALYGALQRLERQGMIQALRSIDRRRPYEITKKGREFLEAELATMRRVAGAAGLGNQSGTEMSKISMPSYYESEELEHIQDEIDRPATKAPGHSPDQLPFDQIGGRRFEILTYLIKQEENKDSIVTLVKASGDQGRDVLIHVDGKLDTIVQCKNLGNKLGRPDLLDELMKVVLHDWRERFIPEEGITYELWAPAGLTKPAEDLVANWPRLVLLEDLRAAFIRTIGRYKALKPLLWEEVGTQVAETLAKRIRLQRFTGIYLSYRVRSFSEIFAQFFECTVVLKQEHVKTAISSECSQITEQIAQLTERREGDEIDVEINEARDLINGHNFKDADVILRRLQSKKQHKLSKNQRFRIASNFGAIAFGEGRAEEAARYFLEAVLLEPDDERARTNEVFAHFLRRDFGKTFQLAAERRLNYPHSPRLAALWIMCAPPQTSVEELTRLLDSAVLVDPEVCVALARRFMMVHELSDARVYASTAVAAQRKWSQPYQVRAQIALGELVMELTGRSALGASRRKVVLEEGLADINKALGLAETDGPWAKAEALVTRCELKLFSGDNAGAREDARAAVQLDPNNVSALLALAQSLLRRGSTDQGIELLQEAYEKERRGDIVLMLAKSLAQRAGEGDLARAVEVATSLSVNTVPDPLRSDFVIGVMQCIAKKLDWALASGYLNDAEAFIDTATAKMLRGFVAHGSGAVEEANRFALEASQAITASSDSSTIDFLGGLFMQLGRPEDALPLYERLFAMEIPSFNGLHLLQCAARLQLDRKVMEICEEMHKRQGLDWNTLQFEVQYLEKYDAQKGIVRLQEFLKSHPGHKLAQVRLSVLAYLHRRPDLVRASMKDLPTVEHLPIEYLFPTLDLMRHGEDRDLAVDYAYRFLRIHFDRQEAHEAYLQTVLSRVDPEARPDMDVVGPNAAVLCEETPRGELRWFVLEDTDKPVRDFEEISLASPLASELMGKRVGERVTLAPQSMGNREGVIKQILTKYVRRFQHCGSELKLRFNRSTMLQSVQIEPDTNIAQPGLVAIMTSVQERAQQLALLQSWYAEQPLSLHLYGFRFGHNAYEALLHAAQTEGMSVKCFAGAPSDTEKALSKLRERPVIVLDLTVTATLRLLGLERVLTSKLYKWVATQGTWEELQNTLTERTPSERATGTFGYLDGQFYFHEEDPEIAAQRAAANAAFLDCFYANVEIVPAPELAGVEPKHRELLINFLGQYGAEAVVVAKRPEMVLWTDDGPQAQLGFSVFATNRIWTQVLLLSLTEASVLNQDDYSAAVAKLIGFGFSSTFFDSRVMFECSKIAEFKTSKFPLKQLIEVFQNAALPGRGIIREFLSFFVLLHHDPALDQYKNLIVCAFLDALWRNPATHSIVLSLRSLSSKLFGLNVSAESAFNHYFDNWRRSLNRPLF